LLHAVPRGAPYDPARVWHVLCLRTASGSR
jgi:hypothetical protein